MDAFQFGNVKAEKAKAMRRYNHFAAISKTLRILELCVALLLLSWILARLPFAVKISAEYFRKLSAFAGSPLFVFAVSNAIIAALVAQSGRLTGQHSAGDNADRDAGLYQEFLKNSSTDRAKPPPPEAEAPPRAAAEVECQDKQVIVSQTSTTVDRTVRDRAAIDTCTEKDSESGENSGMPNYRRSQSEKWKGVTGKMLRRKLRRSETENHRENSREDLYPQDKLSNEEFQRTIEAFIAKQMRFLREESSAIVVHNPS